jgi:hypothetical protein
MCAGFKDLSRKYRSGNNLEDPSVGLWAIPMGSRFEQIYWIYLAQEKDQRVALVNG